MDIEVVSLSPRVAFCFMIYSFATMIGCWINVRYWLKKRPRGRIHCRKSWKSWVNLSSTSTWWLCCLFFSIWKNLLNNVFNRFAFHTDWEKAHFVLMIYSTWSIFSAMEEAKGLWVVFHRYLVRSNLSLYHNIIDIIHI